MKPFRENSVSVATMRTSPTRMRKMTPTRRSENISRRNRNANNKTKIREEFLTIAVNGEAGVRVVFW